MVPCRLEDIPKLNVMKCEYLLALNEKRYRDHVRLVSRFHFHLAYEKLPKEYPRLFIHSGGYAADGVDILYGRPFTEEIDVPNS